MDRILAASPPSEPVPRETIDAISNAMGCSARRVRAAITELSVSSPVTFEAAADALDLLAPSAAKAGWSLPWLTGVLICFASAGWQLGLNPNGAQVMRKFAGGTSAHMYLMFVRFDMSKPVGCRLEAIRDYAQRQQESGAFDLATRRVEARIEGVPEALRGHFDGLKR